MSLTDRTLIELLEYVRRNATLPGPCIEEAPGPNFCNPVERGFRPREDDEDTVSIELVPPSEVLNEEGTPPSGTTP